MSNPLTKLILRMIAASGPMPIAEYMHLCHAHPQYGYYATGNPLGKKGDFITAPEVSQMFGELIAIWCIKTWQAMGSIRPLQIAELGPGSGTMMKDFLRTAATQADFDTAIELHLVETSASLQKQQHETLANDLQRIQWISTLEDLPTKPTIFIGNEFLDAIPFRQFVKFDNQWHERCVTSNDSETLVFAYNQTTLDPVLLPVGHERETDGAVFETAPARQAILATLCAHIKNHGGAMLMIDYGHANPGFGDTFQALRAHQKTDLLSHPGKADLTSHVDFHALAITARAEGLHCQDLISQQDFLLELGLLERAGALGRNNSKLVQRQITQDVERLVSPKQMGSLFKVFCASNPGSC